MSRRLEAALSVAIPTLSGVLVLTLLSKLYVVPLFFNDSNGFIRAALWIPDMAAYRTPLYGWLLIAAERMNQPMLPVWFQQCWWIACVAAFSTLVRMLSGSTFRTIVFGMLFVGVETAIMYTPGAQWFLLSDPLYADWVTLGLLLMLIGARLPRSGVTWTGAVFVGLSCLLRPIPDGIVLGIVILLHGKTIRTALRNRRTLTGIAALVIPILMLATANKIVAGAFSTSPLKAINLAYYTNALLQPDDRIYDDPELDRAFHLAVEHWTVDPRHDGVDPYFLGAYRDLQAEFRFFGSLSSTKNMAVKRFEVGAMSTRVTMRLILRHPMEYARLVAEKTLQTMIPRRNNRALFFLRKNPFTLENLLGYSWQSPNGAQWKIGRNFTDPYTTDLRIAPMIDAESYGIRLPQRAGGKTVALLAVITALAMTESIRRLRSNEPRLRLLGLSILVCLAHTYLNALAIALITMHDDPRYGLPGIMTGTAAVLLTLLSLSMINRTTITRMLRKPA